MEATQTPHSENQFRQRPSPASREVPLEAPLEPSVQTKVTVQASEPVSVQANASVQGSIQAPVPAPSPEVKLTSADELAIDAYFKACGKIGSYAVIDVVLNLRERVQIVVDQNMPWLKKQVGSFFGPETSKLSFEQIAAFVDYLREQKERAPLAAVLGLAPHKHIERSKFLRVFYLEDIRHSESQKPLILSLITQILFEKYSSLESRVAVLETHYLEKTTRGHVVLIRNRKHAGVRVLDPMHVFKEQSITSLNALHETRVLPSGSFWELQVRTQDFRVQHPTVRYSERSKIFSVIAGNGKELAFQVTGRSPAEKRFKREQEEYTAAGTDALVPLEIGFHPYWRRLGHTTLRIGESLYELSSKGWKVHGQGADSARAYLFNNPFFKQQYALFSRAGMPPVSIAVTLLIAKHKVERLQLILENLVAAQGRTKEKFSLYWNNCNQGIMRVLSQAGIDGFESRGYLGFSSILSFRKVLLFPAHRVGGLYIYPLPGSEINEVNLRTWIPRLIYRYNDTRMEVTRAIPSLAWDSVVFFAKRVGGFLHKYLRLKLWKGAEPYVMT